LDNGMPALPARARCTTGPERRITRWENKHLLEAVQERLDANPQAMRVRRETAEHPFGTLKMRMGATHFLKAPAQGSDRDGLARAGLQSHARHEHYQSEAPAGGHPGMRGRHRPAKISTSPDHSKQARAA
jgi:hypothetical protein